METLASHPFTVAAVVAFFFVLAVRFFSGIADWLSGDADRRLEQVYECAQCQTRIIAMDEAWEHLLTHQERENGR